MKTIHTTKGEFIFVEVPDDAKNISKCWQSYGKVRADRKCTEVQYFSNNPMHPNYRSDNPKEMGVIHLFNKETLFEIISTTKDITEEQAESIVHFEKDMGWEDYYGRFVVAGSEFSMSTATESLQSLMQANGLDKNYLILKKI